MKKIFLLIILMGIFLRVAWINSSPPSLYGDELTIALDSYSLLHTGMDQLGNVHPLTLQMGAGRPAGYVYGSIPFVALFGPGVLGVRSLSLLSGLMIILLMYYIGRRLFSNQVGLAAAFIASFSIWDISLSRTGFEAHFALFLALLGVFLFLKAKEKPILYIFSALSFGLTLHTYPTYKVSLLLFLPLLLWFIKGSILPSGKKYFGLGVLTFTLLGVLALSQTFIGGSELRFSTINIFSNDQLKARIEQKVDLERKISSLPLSLSQYFHNKPIEYSKVFIENYLQNFSLDFLIIHGDRNPRHNMATMGEISFAELILILIGILTFWQKQKKILIFLIFWILIAPIPTALVDLPHTLRSSFMLPGLILLSALGLSFLLNQKNKVALSSIGLIFVIQFVFFIQKLYFLAPNEYSNFWSYPAKMAVEIVLENKNKYSYIILSDRINDIEYAYPAYVRLNPREIIAQNKKRETLGNYQLKKFDNVYIGDIPEGEIKKFINSLGKSVLYIGPKGDERYVENYTTAYGLDKDTALVVSKVSP